ncbi:MAG: PilZ domain-containing protein [Acidobacteriia bacterium]|nr:PilZ domain-containing protein [Terriglobia bacterium]
MGDPGSPSDSGKAPREKRAVPRYTLIATVDVVEPVSGVRISGRISELSRKGCYVDALNNLPPQTPVNIRISRDRGTFSSPGKIIYVQEAMGMGLTFLEIPDDQLKILDSWLAEFGG